MLTTRHFRADLTPHPPGSRCTYVLLVRGPRRRELGFDPTRPDQTPLRSPRDVRGERPDELLYVFFSIENVVAKLVRLFETICVIDVGDWRPMLSEDGGKFVFIL